MPPVNMVDPASGKTFAVEEGDVSARARDGWHVEGSAESANRITSDQVTEDYSGSTGKVNAALFAGARGLSLGTSDAALAALGGSAAARELRRLKDENPITSGVAEAGGALLGGVGEIGLAGEASKLGSAIADVGEGASFLQRTGRAAAGFGAEGALQGLGSGVSELALSDDPLSIERAASVLSSNALLGGAVGAGTGVASKFVERGVLRAKGLLEDAATRLGNTGGDIAGDLAQLDAKGLREAETVEREALATKQGADRASTVEGITAYRDAVKQANPWLVVEGEPSALLSQSSKSLRGAMNDPIGLAKNPGTVLKTLRVQEQALTRALENGEEMTAKLAARSEKFTKDLAVAIEDAEVGELGDVALKGQLAKRYGAFADVRVPKGADLKIAPKKATEFLEALKSGAVATSEQKAIAEIPKLVEANRALQQRIETAMVPKAELTSQRLAQIADARDALGSAPKGSKGLSEQLVHGSAFGAVTGAVGSIPIVGQIPGLAPLLGAKAASTITDLVFGRIGKTSAEVAARTAKAVDSFLTATGKAAKVAPVLATKVLSSVRYAEQSKAAADENKPRMKTPLATAYVARAAELRSQTQFGPTGAPVMRPEARMKMATALDPIRAVSPIFADRLETLAARRVEFLASKLPRRPDLPGMQFNHDDWHPSDMEMRAFARYAAAVEDPGGVEERLAGGKVTPEDAEVMRSVYPERYADLVRQIVEQASTKKLPYNKRLSLSMFADTALDASLDPHILSALQATYTAEPGTGGGVEPPKAQPQFGSVKNQETTASQQRQGDV